MDRWRKRVSEVCDWNRWEWELENGYRWAVLIENGQHYVSGVRERNWKRERPVCRARLDQIIIYIFSVN